jgi:general secretion pathway protein E
LENESSQFEGFTSAIGLLDEIVAIAVRKQSSDIHLEALNDSMAIKLRIDGVLSSEGLLSGRSIADQLISRIKVLAELDIAEKRIPQDGRLRLVVQNREIDIRVSIMPSVIGEDAVLRLLDKTNLTQGNQRLSLEALGFDQASASKIRQLATLPYGMLLVTGPTGSGKTTTLYALLSELANPEQKTITIEDPVEYRIQGLLQIPVNEKKGLTFAKGLRSILRHDPDRLLVGEIRDQETAEISVQAALTGHQVFTTIHANGVLDVISRFTHMGCDLHALSSALNGVVAQRLVRVLCNSCARSSQLNIDKKRERGGGCDKCRGSGYFGRIAFAEILIVDDHLRQLIVQRRPNVELKNHLKQQNFFSLYDTGSQLVAAGTTTQQELDRVAMQTL